MKRKGKLMTQRIRLGRTDLLINPIGLGANAVGGHNIYPNLDEKTGMDVVRTAIEHGMNFIDTAYSYGMGRSEELIGEVMKEVGGREHIVIATKGAQNIASGERVIDNSPAFLKQTVDDSLQRLQTDHLDLFYIHQPDKTTPKEEAVGALQELKEAGKIRAIGLSNFSMEQLKEANKDGYVDVFQGGYNLLDRSAEQNYLPYMAAQNISFIPYFPLASGLLTGKYDKNTTFPEGDLRNNQPHFQGKQFKENLAKVEKLREIAEAKQVEVVHIVLAWYLTREAIDSVIPGAKTPNQVIHNLKTLDVKLSENEIEKIDQIFKA